MLCPSCYNVLQPGGPRRRRGGSLRRVDILAGNAGRDPTANFVRNGLGPAGDVVGRRAARAEQNGGVADVHAAGEVALGSAEIDHTHIHADRACEGPKLSIDTDRRPSGSETRIAVAVADAE